MKPRCKDRSISDRRSLPRQDEKRGLKGILRIGLLIEDEATNPQHHRPVTLNRGPEGVTGINEFRAPPQ